MSPERRSYSNVYSWIRDRRLVLAESALSPWERGFYTLAWFDSLVCDGGLAQGFICDEWEPGLIVKLLTKIGAHQRADLVARFIQMIPTEVLEAGGQAIGRFIFESKRGEEDSLTTEYYAQQDEFRCRMVAFARQNGVPDKAWHYDREKSVRSIEMKTTEGKLTGWGLIDPQALAMRETRPS